MRIAFVVAGLPAGAGATDETVLENVVVTGTRIARQDFETPSPVVTVPAEAFRRTGANSIELTLNSLPQFVPSATSTSNNPSNDGQANVSLRGLGTQRTLVLLDGRRVVAADGRGAVDLNLLPPALLGGVEIVSGGASVAYGSEAIAGVVNLKLKDSFDGVALDGSWSGTDRGDGEEYSLGISAGTSFADGRGSIMGYAGYAERAQINQDAREVSRYPLEYFADASDGRGPGGAFVPSGSGFTDDGINIVFSSRTAFDDLFATYGYPVGSVPPAGESPQAGLGVNADGTLFTTGNGEPGSVVNFRGERDPVMFNDRSYSISNAADIALQMPLERTSALARGELALTDQVEAYLQGLYTQYTVNRQLEPAAVGILLIPVTNPFVPADLGTLLSSRQPNPAAPYRHFRRAGEVGPQVAENDRSVWQATAGTRGRLRGDWSFDVYAQFGQNDRTERQTNNVLLSKLQDLTFADDGGLSICAGGFNPYVAGSLSPECASYIAADAANEVTTTQRLGEVSANGPLLRLPGGDLRAGIGLFYRREEFTYDADATLAAVLPGVPGVIGPRPDVAGFPAAPDRTGAENNTDAYLELLAPLLKDKPGVQSLELGLGYRYSDHSQAGAADAYKAELLYRPAKPLRLRGSYQHAVRAPSIEELYYPPVSSQFLVPRPDPCTYDSKPRTGPDKAQVEALCLAQGLPPALLPGFRYELRRADGVSGGNPELEPEQADTYTVGFVVTAGSTGSTLGAVQLSADWYRITLEDGIGRWDSESAVSRCYDRRYNPNYDVQNVYCTFFTRAAETGYMHLLLLDRNIGGLETAGVDLQLDWSLDAGPGRIVANAYLTYVDTWQYSDPDGGTIEYADTLGGTGLGRSIPRWKSLLSLGYNQGALALFTRWQHIDGMRDVNEREFEVPAYDYLDCGASFAFGTGIAQGLTAHAGVDNVLDKEPPIFPSWQQGNTDPSQYDVLGRRYYLRLQYQF